MASILFFCSCCSLDSASADTLNTLIPPYTQPGATQLATGLTPQTAPVHAPFSAAGLEFGLNSVDPTTSTQNRGLLSASISGAWTQYSTAQGSASVSNGTLGASARVDTTNFSANFLQANAVANFEDALTVSMAGTPIGTPGLFDMLVTLDGNLSCDDPRNLCNSGVVFGYGVGTLGLSVHVHLVGGEQPVPGSFSTTLELVPLPFLNGEPFNINLELATTARLHSVNGIVQGAFDLSDFSSTMQVTGINVTDTQGTPVNFSIASTSGLSYGPQGIAPVPEPAAFSMVLPIALSVLLLCRRKSDS